MYSSIYGALQRRERRRGKDKEEGEEGYTVFAFIIMPRPHPLSLTTCDFIVYVGPGSTMYASIYGALQRRERRRGSKEEEEWEALLVELCERAPSKDSETGATTGM